MERGLTRSLHLSVKQLTTVGMLTGITIFMGLTRLGFIPLPTGVNATIMHLPVIIGALLEGPLVGSIIGLAFGLFSMYQAFTAPTLLSFWFWNPIIAIVPRILIAIISYYTYKILKNKLKTAAIGVAAITGTLINTIGVLSLAYVFYLDKIAMLLNLDPSAVGKYMLVGVGITNGIPEAIVSSLITVPIVVAIKKIRK